MFGCVPWGMVRSRVIGKILGCSGQFLEGLEYQPNGIGLSPMGRGIIEGFLIKGVTTLEMQF